MKNLELNINMVYDRMKWKERIYNLRLQFVRSEEGGDDDNNDLIYWPFM